VSRVRETFRGPVARLAASGVVLVAAGCAILSQLDGWLGVGLWIVTAPLVCIGIELALRPKAKPRSAARTGPALVVKLGRRPGSAPAKPPPASPFAWHSQSRSRRRSR
jgi:hypothetical protein